MGILTFGNQNPVVQSQARDGNPAPLRQDWVLRGRDERCLQSFDGQSKTCGLSTASRGDDGWCGCAAQLRQRPQSVARPDLFDRFRRSIMEENRCSRRMAKPVTSGRRNAEDLRSRTVVRHRFLLDRYTGPIGLKHFVRQNRRMLPSTFAPPTECTLFLIIPGTVNAVVLEARLRDSLD